MKRPPQRMVAFVPSASNARLFLETFFKLMRPPKNRTVFDIHLNPNASNKPIELDKAIDSAIR